MTMDEQVYLDREAGLERGLSKAQIIMIGLGGAIGTGLFMGSGIAIGYAGPAGDSLMKELDGKIKVVTDSGRSNNVEANDRDYRTSVDKLYAAGDVRRGEDDLPPATLGAASSRLNGRPQFSSSTAVDCSSRSRVWPQG